MRIIYTSLFFLISSLLIVTNLSYASSDETFIHGYVNSQNGTLLSYQFPVICGTTGVTQQIMTSQVDGYFSFSCKTSNNFVSWKPGENSCWSGWNSPSSCRPQHSISFHNQHDIDVSFSVEKFTNVAVPEFNLITEIIAATFSIGILMFLSPTLRRKIFLRKIL